MDCEKLFKDIEDFQEGIYKSGMDKKAFMGLLRGGLSLAKFAPKLTKTVKSLGNFGNVSGKAKGVLNSIKPTSLSDGLNKAMTGQMIYDTASPYLKKPVQNNFANEPRRVYEPRSFGKHNRF